MSVNRAMGIRRWSEVSLGVVNGPRSGEDRGLRTSTLTDSTTVPHSAPLSTSSTIITVHPLLGLVVFPAPSSPTSSSPGTPEVLRALWPARRSVDTARSITGPGDLLPLLTGPPFFRCEGVSSVVSLLMTRSRALPASCFCLWRCVTPLLDGDPSYPSPSSC